MAEFRKCFHAIDTENTGVITVEDLRAYMHRMHYKEQFVSKWISLFDPRNEGVITYETYCRTLGLIPRRLDTKQTAGSSKDAGPDAAGKSAQASPVTEQPIDAGKTEDTVTTLGEATPSHKHSTDDVGTPVPEPESPKPADSKSKKKRKSKRSQSDHLEESKLSEESPCVTEDLIVPTVCVRQTAEEPTIHPYMETDPNEELERSKTDRTSTSSQFEESPFVVQPDDTYEAERKSKETELEIVTPEVTSTNVEGEKSRHTKDPKPAKRKDRKHKHSESAEQMEPPLQSPSNEEPIEPGLDISVRTTPPIEPVLSTETRGDKKRKRQKSRNSQSEQLPSTNLPLSTDSPECSTYTEEPMQGIEQITPVHEPLSSAVHAQESQLIYKTSEELDREDKGLKESRSDEHGLQDASVAEEEAVLLEEVIPTVQQTVHKHHKPKKPRSKKSSQSHSESHDVIHEIPSVDQSVKEEVVAEQPMQVAASTIPKVTQVELKQSTTPLLSPSPIPPSEQFVCVGALDTSQPSPLFHDFTQEMEVQLVGTMNSSPTMEHSVSIAEPVKTGTAAIDSAQTIREDIVPHLVVPSSTQTAHSKPKPTKKHDKPTAEKNAAEVAHRVDESKSKRKVSEQPKTDEKDTLKSTQKEAEQVKKKKMEVPKSLTKDKTRTGDQGREKKTIKEKHVDAKSVKEVQETMAPQTSAKSKDAKSTGLTKLKRVKPIFVRNLKDKKPRKSVKDDEPSAVDAKESDEQTKKKNRFPRGFMVQLDPERCARKSKLALRQHERRLQRKIDRLEKRARKPRKTIKPKYRWKVRPSLRSRGVIVILLAGRHRGKRVVCLGRQRSTGLLLVTGPFRYNGCPLRRVHPNMVIATKTCLNLGKFVIPCRIHKKGYFARKTLQGKRRKLDDSLLLKPDGEQDSGYRPDEQRKADQKLIDTAVCQAIKSHADSRMLIKYLKSLFSIGKYDRPHKMIF